MANSLMTFLSRLEQYYSIRFGELRQLACDLNDTLAYFSSPADVRVGWVLALIPGRRRILRGGGALS